LKTIIFIIFAAMQNKFRSIFLSLFVLVLISGCIKKPTEDDIEKSLSNAMVRYLNDPAHIDTSIVKFSVKDVIFFDDKTQYQCEFKIRLVSPGKDTTGVMTASISKDFERVHRKS
jgi:hypothetical protein